MTAAHDPTVVAELRRRDAVYRQAHDEGRRGAPFDPDAWPDDPGVVDAWQTGRAERRRARRPDRLALTAYDRVGVRTRRRWVRRLRQRPALIVVAALVAVVALVVFAAVTALWLAGRLVSWLAQGVRLVETAWRPATAGTDPSSPEPPPF